MSLFAGHRVRRLLAAAACACLAAVPLARAARVDWDGGDVTTNTTLGGSANTAANWGPSGGGADGSGGAAPGTNDDVVLNDVASGSAVTRTVTVDSLLSWRSLTLAQSTAPAAGVNSNVVALTAGGLILAGSNTLSLSGAPNAISAIDFGAGNTIFATNTVSTLVVLSSNTVLTGSGAISNVGNGTMVFRLDGAVLGNNRIVTSIESKPSQFVLGPSATLGGTQTWILASSLQGCSFSNQIVNPAQWANGALTITVTGPGASFEAATSSSNPAPTSNYRFARITLNSGNSGQSHTLARLRNFVQNDGGTPGTKEGVYASSWAVGSAGDGSGGHYLIDLNGQDWYVDRFTNMVNFDGKSVQFVNTALASTSSVRAVATTGDTLIGGSFAVMNNASLDIVGGNWFDTTYNRNVGDYPADASAVPNSAGTGFNVDAMRMWDGKVGTHASYNHYLGNGPDTAGNSATAYAGTPGTLRIVGGDYTMSALVLNPIAATGTVDTLSANPAYPDTTPNTITVRAAMLQAVTNFSTSTGVMLAPNHRLSAGAPVQVIATTTPGGITMNTLYYYVVNPTANGFQLATTPGGTPVVPSTSGAGVGVRDNNGQANLTALPGITVAGQTTIKGNLTVPVLSGAVATGNGGNVSAPVFQPTFRVGGTVPVSTGVTVDPATDTLTLSSGNVTNGQAIYLTGGLTVTGLVYGQVYYARDVAGSSFKVAAWPAEPAIDILTPGTSVSNVTSRMTNSASLTVTGDLNLESRLVTGYMGSGGNITIAAINGDGATVTVSNSLNHGLTPGDMITVAAGTASFRGTFPVANVLSPTVYTYALPVSGSGGSVTISYTKTVSVGVAIQSNAAVTVGGNAAIGGLGVYGNYRSTGMGPGIDPWSHFTLNGGLATTQTVTIVPAVGRFHVGEGANGVLTGNAARALLATNLTVAGALDVNGGSMITSVTANAGITLTNGAGLVFGPTASIAIAGTLTAGTNSVIDLSTGDLAVGGLNLAGGGIIDLKGRLDAGAKLRVAGDASAQLAALTASGNIRHSTLPLVVTYYPALGYTGVKVSTRGTVLEVD